MKREPFQRWEKEVLNAMIVMMTACLYLGFPVVVIAQRNDNHEKGNHVHRGHQRLDGAEELGRKYDYQHIVEIAQHDRARELIGQRTLPEEEDPDRAVNRRQDKDDDKRQDNHGWLLPEKRRIAVEDTQVDQREHQNRNGKLNPENGRDQFGQQVPDHFDNGNRNKNNRRQHLEHGQE